MLKQLFESLDKEVFTDELVESVQAEFDSAVEAKLLIAESEMKDKILLENVEILDAEKSRLIAESNDKFEALKTETADKLNSYLELVVEEIVKDNEIELTAVEEKSKVDAMVEAFSGFMITAGVEVAQISEAIDSGDAEVKLAEQIEVNNSLVEENISVKAQNQEFLKMGVINEMKEGLSLVEAEKFGRLSELVEFSGDEKFAEKLETLKESVKGFKEPEIVPEKDKEVLDESTKNPKECAFSHLL